MEVQKPSTNPSDTHNLALNTFLPSNQVKHLAYIRIQAPRIIFYEHKQLKLITGLATATNNTVRLYAIYENAVAFELGSWRLHEDINGMLGWDRVLIVYTKQKIVGLRYESDYLRNTFLVSLQFLPLDGLDECKVYADRMGYYFIVYIRNYLILCFSQTLKNKYNKAQIYARDKVEIVQKTAFWNEISARSFPLITSMIKIRLTDLDINAIDQVCLVDETVYFTGHKGKDCNLYFMHVSCFFNNIAKSNNATETVLAPQVPQRDQPPSKCKVIISHPRSSTNMQTPDFLYIKQSPSSLSLKSQQILYEIATFQKRIQVFTQSATMFPILVWQKDADKFTIIQRYRTFQDTFDFKHTNLAESLYAEQVIYRQGLVIVSSKTNVTLLTTSGHRKVLHSCLGSIVDFHVGRDMLLIQNGERKSTRIFDLSRGPKQDPRPFVTHKKKNFLEKITDLQGIYTSHIGSKNQILAVKSNKVYHFYKEGAQFQSTLESAREYFEFSIKQENFIILRSLDGLSGKIATQKDQNYVMEQVLWKGWSMDKRWCLQHYLIANSGSQWVFLNIISKQISTIEVSVQRSGKKFLDSFIQLKKVSIQRLTKDHEQVQLYLFYNKSFQIWQLNLNTFEKKIIFQSSNIAEGHSQLTNGLFHPETVFKDKFRSITCAQYILSDHGLRYDRQAKEEIIAVHFENNQKKTLLIFITSDEEILIYRKYFGIQDGNFQFRRVCTPLNMIKSFRWGAEKCFRKLGHGALKIGNFLLYKGELLESTQVDIRSLFKMQGFLWGLIGQNKIRQIQLGNEVTDGFCMRQIQCSFKEQLMGVQSTAHYYCVYSRKGFQIYNKQFQSHWRCNLGNQRIMSLKMFEHYVGMSYYDYYCNQQGVQDYQSIRFRFRIYNCTTKNKIIERQKPLDEPILHIRFVSPDKLILVTSSLIFINILKNDKTLQPYRAHNFTTKRNFLTSFAYIPDILPSFPGAPSSPAYMLFGGSHGGLGFYVGKWIQQQKLKQQWFEGLRCPIRQVSFFHFDEQRAGELKALISDEDGNLVILGLKKDRAEKIADFRLGTKVNSIKSKSGQEIVIFVSCNDGSIRMLNAVNVDNQEVNYLDFQNYFCSEIPFIGGFNLRGSRQLSQQYRSARFVSKGNVLDGDILEQYFSMTKTLQQYISDESEMQPATLKAAIPF